MSRPVQRPVEITQWDQVLDMLAGHADKSIIPFSSGVPDINQPSLKPLWRELSRVAQHNLKAVLGYDELPGCRELRQQIARLMLDGGSVINADDIVITNGSQSGMSLALLAVCQPRYRRRRIARLLRHDAAATRIRDQSYRDPNRSGYRDQH